MTINKKELFRTRLEGIKTTLEKASEAQKRDRVAVALVENFNEIVQQIAAAYPDLDDSLPKQIRTGGPYSQIGQSPISFLDLEALCEQTLNLLRLVEE